LQCYICFENRRTVLANSPTFTAIELVTWRRAQAQMLQPAALDMGCYDSTSEVIIAGSPYTDLDPTSYFNDRRTTKCY